MKQELFELPHVVDILRRGIFRPAAGDAALVLAELVRDAFYRFRAAEFSPLGSDWLGRIFISPSENPDLTYMLEPGTGEILEIPASAEGFYRDTLAQQPDAALAVNFFEDWVESGGPVPKDAQCIGYKIPLFLGGKDHLTNLELGDMDVYWSIFAQLTARFAAQN